MQGLKVCAQWLSTAGRSMGGKSLLDVSRVCGATLGSDFHTTSIANKENKGSKPMRWELLNKKIFPVQTPDEPRRPAVTIKFIVSRSTIDTLLIIDP